MKQLTPEQAEALGERIGPTVGYFFRLFERLEKVGFNPPDKLHQLVKNARDALYYLSIELPWWSGPAARPAAQLADLTRPRRLLRRGQTTICLQPLSATSSIMSRIESDN